MFVFFVCVLLACFCVWGANRAGMLLCLRDGNKDAALRRLLSKSGVPAKYVLRLLKEGANVNAYNLENKEPPSLYLAVSGNQSLGVIEALAENGAHINGEPPLTPLLFFCLIFRRTDVFDFLISKGADLGCVLDDGSTLLHAAAVCGNADVAETLIKSRGFDVNYPNKEGVTPLMAAYRSGNKKLISKLLEAGADRHARDREGRMPQDYKPRGIFQKLRHAAAVLKRSDGGPIERQGE